MPVLLSEFQTMLNSEQNDERSVATKFIVAMLSAPTSTHHFRRVFILSISPKSRDREPASKSPPIGGDLGVTQSAPSPLHPIHPSTDIACPNVYTLIVHDSVPSNAKRSRENHVHAPDPLRCYNQIHLSHHIHRVSHRHQPSR